MILETNKTKQKTSVTKLTKTSSTKFIGTQRRTISWQSITSPWKMTEEFIVEVKGQSQYLCKPTKRWKKYAARTEVCQKCLWNHTPVSKLPAVSYHPTFTWVFRPTMPFILSGMKIMTGFDRGLQVLRMTARRLDTPWNILTYSRIRLACARGWGQKFSMFVTRFKCTLDFWLSLTKWQYRKKNRLEMINWKRYRYSKLIPNF